MILTAYLASRYAKHMPLSLSASLVFEQTYGHVEGDSASAAQLSGMLLGFVFVARANRDAYFLSAVGIGVPQLIGTARRTCDSHLGDSLLHSLCSTLGLSHEMFLSLTKDACG